jgi:hypothetical protein
MEVTGVERRMGELQLNGFRVTIWGDGNILETDNGDDYATLNYLMSLNCTLKMAKMINFVFAIMFITIYIYFRTVKKKKIESIL